MPETPLLVFADDWGRHPSSCQHLVRRLSTRHPVCWVNTIGTRPPRFDRATFTRGAEKLRQWMTPSIEAPDTPANLRVLSPRMWPWFGGKLHRRVNRELLLRQLSAAIESLPAPPVAVTTIPIVADLIDQLPVTRWVYYCVDDFGLWPGLDHRAMRSMEERLVHRADVLIAASVSLQERLAGMGRDAHLLTHGTDLEFWDLPDQADAPCPELATLARPLVIFWGLIDRRMDVAMVNHLAARMERGTIVLIGPENDPDPATYESNRVVRIPSVAYERLPFVARDAAVLVMPYADLPVTRAMQPLKLKEYLATGKPVVASALPSTRPWADCMDVVETPEAFSEAVLRRLHGELPDAQRTARACLGEESWDEKARQFASWALDDAQPYARTNDRVPAAEACLVAG